MKLLFSEKYKTNYPNPDFIHIQYGYYVKNKYMFRDYRIYKTQSQSWNLGMYLYLVRKDYEEKLDA